MSASLSRSSYDELGTLSALEVALLSAPSSHRGASFCDYNLRFLPVSMDFNRFSRCSKLASKTPMT
jgi:hypothetical protein